MVLLAVMDVAILDDLIQSAAGTKKRLSNHTYANKRPYPYLLSITDLFS